ncbi:MAG: glutathione S-transferase family protein [Alphaproteobacteria bacterium]|nr:glutathione S-transferase family protein [Alphaproteobacteria bacterium]
MPQAHYFLHHHPLDPPSRRVRLALAEKDLLCELILEKPWEPRDEYLKLNPSGEVPTLIIEPAEARSKTIALSNAGAICEYLEETISARSLLGDDPLERAEIRRLISWFEDKMYREVTSHLVEEKALKRLQGEGGPDSARIHTAYHNIHAHMSYIGWLTEHRNWLAGDDITLADLAAAAQLSIIDYLGDVPWDKHHEAKEWYARIKSRPSFRSLLGDHIAGLLPPRHYADLDF